MKENHQLPRVLVISFNGFLSSNANGRSLMNLFAGWEKDKLAQFYMSSDIPDFETCGRYFRVTDEEALSALFGKKVGRTILPQESTTQKNGSIYMRAKANRKNQVIRYLRQLIWETGRWESKEFYRWIEEFSPQAILLFSGNNAFVDHCARKIARKYNLPVFLYNCEDYYLKKQKTRSLFGWLNRRHCDRAFEKTMRMVAGVIYNSKKLQNSYAEKFPSVNSIVLMNPANEFEITPLCDENRTGVSYLGNISVGREESLCEIADVLAKFGHRLDVYGNFATAEAKESILRHANIDYHGTVPYARCCEIMQNSLLLIHCESFSERYEQDLRHAFSTKIADSLACGTPLLIYAPESIAFTEYIKETQAAAVVTEKSDLQTVLREVLENADYRRELVDRALYVAKQNHTKVSLSKECERFICKTVESDGGL